MIRTKELKVHYDQETKILYAAGIDRYNKKDYGEAMDILEKAANRGHCAAMFWVGVMYHKGYIVDTEEKRSVYTKPDEARFDYDFVIEKNYTEAMRWYTKSAELGYPDAFYRLGIMYWNGEGLEKRQWDQAVEYLHKGSIEGSPYAMKELVEMYKRGIFVEKNLTKSQELETNAEKAFKSREAPNIDFSVQKIETDILHIAQNMLDFSECIHIDNFNCKEGDRIDLSKTEIPNYDALSFEEEIVAKWSVHYNEKEILVLDHVREESLASECFIFGSSDAAQEEL